MKVLFQSRTTVFSAPGGDTVQLLKTREYLEKLGVEVDIAEELEPDVSAYDLVHVFNLMRVQEAWLQVRNAWGQEKPVALSTIYGLYTEYEQKARGGLFGLIARHSGPYMLEYLKIAARCFTSGELHKGALSVLGQGYYRTLKRIVSRVDVFLPNSDSEMARVAREMKLVDPPYISVPNAVDTEVFDYDRVDASAMAEYQGCLVCAARIEGRKSQLNLVRAMRDLPYRLLIIGKPSPNHMAYYEQVRQEAGDNVTFIDAVDHETLAGYYKVAKASALISWMETPGLSSLEAAAMGCNLVITEKGDTRDYFGDYAAYCEPDDVNSIRRAVVEAMESPFDEALRRHVLDNYTWDRTAAATLKGYRMALTRGGKA
ncbi:glycosyltransferase family 4 protein [Thiolapillus brandeum]|uniref:Glycosyl transferase family 1 n=1 Tax=Thiolapillus brandeum TaxID=1076588 RepID=A0A7U6GKX4_9GAMM|nr:glycosyltransferase family 4 protein [Thiolapillus brandeum]BAO45542.1 glycosyl transferase family 1 [Thiolapillus brandeum]